MICRQSPGSGTLWGETVEWMFTMFFVNNVYGGKEPYRVNEAQKSRSDDQSSFQHQFGGDEEEAQEKFRKASEKLSKKKAVVSATEIMNKELLHLEENLSIEEAIRRVKNHQIKYFPIVNEEGKLMGMLSEFDLLHAREKGGQKKLKEITKAETLCAEPDTELGEIMHVFNDQAIEAVPVVNQSQHVVGMLTKNELLETILKITKLV